MAFSTLISYFRSLFGVTFSVLDKKGKEWETNNEKNIKKSLQSRLLDFLLFLIKRNYKQFKQKSWEMLVKELFVITVRCTAYNCNKN